MIDPLSQTFAALADPTRRAMLVRLARGETNVSELARPFDMSLPAITKHLKVLVAAGLVTKRQDAQRRPCSLNADALKDAVDWIEQYRVFWEESFDRLGEHLKSIAATTAEWRLGGWGEENAKARRREEDAKGNRQTITRELELGAASVPSVGAMGCGTPLPVARATFANRHGQASTPAHGTQRR